MVRFLSLGLMFVYEVHAASPVCAARYSEFDKTEALKQLQEIVPSSGFKGFVNGTQGSYFFLRSTDNEIQMTFLTTGLFDLYGIRRDGVIQFCDMQGKVFVVGMGYEEEISILNSVVQLGGGTPRQTFREGSVPELLRQKHDLRSFFQANSQ